MKIDYDAVNSLYPRSTSMAPDPLHTMWDPDDSGEGGGTGMDGLVSGALIPS